MPVYRIQHSIQDVDDLSEDRYVNTFHFFSLGVKTEAELGSLITQVRDFYTAENGVNALALFYASHCGGAGSTCKAYLVDTALSHAPLAEQTFVFPAPVSGVQNMPGEISLVLSYKSTIAPGVAVGRTRGRIYLGPLNDAAQVSTTAVEPSRPSSVFMANIMASAQALKTDSAALGFDWSVQSTTLMKALAPVHSFPITDVSVDNAWDTQRRRGIDASARSSVVLT